MLSFGFMEALDSKGILNALKKVLSQLWNCSEVFAKKKSPETLFHGKGILEHI